MNWRALGYLLLIAASTAAVALTLGTVYRQGSSAISGWATLVKPGELSSRHSFLSQDCEACHSPTRGVEATACISCHATNAAALARESTSFHADIQSCSACHIEHKGEVRPTRMNHQALINIARGNRGHSSVQWLAHGETDESRRASLDCFACHSNRSPHRDLFGRECAACHLDTSWRIAGFKHPSPASTDCAQCHQAPPSHYMGHFHMVSTRVARQEHARVEQCYLCHQTDAWNDIRGVGWYKHH